VQNEHNEQKWLSIVNKWCLDQREPNSRRDLTKWLLCSTEVISFHLDWNGKLHKAV